MIEGILKGIGSLFTSDDERIKGTTELKKVALAFKELQAKLNEAQIAVNLMEAKSSSIFIAGWRPAIGWVGVSALVIQFILHPIASYIVNISDTSITLPIPLDADNLWVMISGMLGIAGMRSFDKKNKTQTNKI
jgi:hypothetical protein